MKTFTPGKYLGQNAEQITLSGLLVTRSSYKEACSSDWHRHENIYMTLILKGGSTEKRKEQEIECVPGMLLVYPQQEMHRNINYRNNSKNLHIEFDSAWFKKYNIDTACFEGRSFINDPMLKCGLISTVAELTAWDQQTVINLEAILLAAFPLTAGDDRNNNKPRWIKKIYELLHDENETDWNLEELSSLLGIHPVTISKYFPKYFRMNIGDYMRMIKIGRSLHLLSKKSIPLEEVACRSGFVDNAHYTRIFKKHCSITPSSYRALVAS